MSASSLFALFPPLFRSTEKGVEAPVFDPGGTNGDAVGGGRGLGGDTEAGVLVFVTPGPTGL